MKFDANVGGVQTNKLGSTVKVQGEGAEADANYSGKTSKLSLNKIQQVTQQSTLR